MSRSLATAIEPALQRALKNAPALAGVTAQPVRPSDAQKGFDLERDFQASIAWDEAERKHRRT